MVKEVSKRHRPEAFQAQVLDSLAEGVFSTDGNGRFTFLNPAACRLLGFAEEADALGREVHALIHHSRLDGTPLPDSECPVRQVLHTGTPLEAWEGHFWRTDGASFPVLMDAMPLYGTNGAMEGVIVSFRDDSARRERESRLAKAARHLPGAIFQYRMDPDGRESFPYVSGGVQELYGISPEEMMRDPARAFARVHPDDLPQLEASIAESVRGVQPWYARFRVRNPQGGWHWVEGRATPEALPDGSVQSHGVLLDITEGVLAEQAREQVLAILDATPDFVAMNRPDGSVTYINRSGLALLGENPEHADLNDSLPETCGSWREVLEQAHPEWARRRILEEGIPAAERQGVWRGETAVIDHKGREIPVSQIILAHRADDGAVIQLSTIMRDISKEKALQAELRRETAFSQAVVRSLPGAFYMFDQAGQFVRWNRHVEEVTGREGEVFATTHPSELFLPEERGFVQRNIEQVFREGSASMEAHVLSVSGETYPYYLTGRRVDLGDTVYLLGVGLDISERRALEDRLRREKALSESILKSLPGVFYMLDSDGRLVRWNEQAERVTGCRPEQLEGADALAFVAETERDRIASFIRQTFSQGSTLVESRLLTVEGETPYLFHGLRIELKGTPFILGVALDISERKALEDELERLATHDPLTGLYNRAKLYELLEQARMEHERYDTPFSLIMYDIDHFKIVNDRFGHSTGDEVLIELTRRVNEALRKTDVQARWGGEEFLVLATHTKAHGAADLAERLREKVEQSPFEGAGPVTISLGVAICESGETVERLLGRVDKALYHAKETGRNRVVVAEPEAREG